MPVSVPVPVLQHQLILLQQTLLRQNEQQQQQQQQQRQQQDQNQDSDLLLIHYITILASFTLFLSFLLVRFYASRRTSMTIQLLATISFAAGFSGTLLLPIDLSMNVHHNQRMGMSVSMDDYDYGGGYGGNGSFGGNYYDNGHGHGHGNTTNNTATGVNATNDGYYYQDYSNTGVDDHYYHDHYYNQTNTNTNTNNNTNTNTNTNSSNTYYNGTLLPWYILFWSTSSLAWVILPIVKEMLLSGQFTLYKQFREGVRKRLRFVFIVAFIAVIAIVWLAIYLHSLNVIPVIITLANTYGLLLVSLLLGYGLIALPRSIWKKAIPTYELRKTQIMAVTADEDLYAAVWELQDVEYEIDAAVSRIVDLDDRDWRDVYYKCCVNDLLQRKHETAELKPELHGRRTTLGQRGAEAGAGRFGLTLSRSLSLEEEEEFNESGGPYEVDDKPSMEELIALNRRLKRAQENLYNTDKRWESIVQKNQDFHEIIHKWSSGRMKWMKYCRTIFFRLIAVLATCLSAIILWSEATLSLPYNLTPFAILQEMLSQKEEGDGYDDFLFQFAAFVPLLYMSMCVSSSIFKLTMFGPFALRGYRQSHGVALIINAQFLARLIFPLGYNYLLMLKYDTSSCAFSTFLGQMEVVPLFGTTFTVYAPLLILALCVITIFDIYPKLLNMLGIEHEDAILIGDQETINAKVNEGITLLRRRNSGNERSCELTRVTERNKSSDDEAMLV